MRVIKVENAEGPMSERARTVRPEERFADACVHGLGIAASLAGAGVLATLAFGAPLPAFTGMSLVVYALGLVAVFVVSAAYHLADRPALKAVLRRFDHATIHVKIAGTYTPFAVAKLTAALAVPLLASVWLLTLIGAAIKLFWPGRLVRTGYVLYLAQGWAILIVWPAFAAAVSTHVLVLIAAGGVLYTIGVLFHLAERMRFHNAIWHGMVLLASACHFAAVLDGVVLASLA
jgi:hemolysin III